MVIRSSPFHSRLELASEPSAVRWARLHAQGVFATWEVPAGAAGDALLVVSELVTNAVRHAGPLPVSAEPAVAGPVRACALFLQRMPDHLLICVYDQDRRPPVLQETSEDGESGRGLRLVEELSAAWGYAYPDPSVGKAVWARVVTVAENAAAQVPMPSSPARRASPRARGWLSRCSHVTPPVRVRTAVGM
jgi:anti-sigma regulatory factor (Ser/Thr protein kinase)